MHLSCAFLKQSGTGISILHLFSQGVKTKQMLQQAKHKRVWFDFVHRL